MSEDQKYYIDDEAYDEIDITALLRKLFGEWRQLLKWAGIGLVLGIVFALTAVKTYTVNTKMAPEIAVRTGGSSSLGSLASLAGVNLGSMGGTDAVRPDIYPAIVSSTPFKIELFSLPVEFSYKKEKVNTDLYDYIVHYTKKPWYSVVLGAPKKALSLVMGIFKGKKTKIEGYENINPANLTGEQAKVVGALNNGIVLNIDKKTGMITTSVTMQDPHVAATLADEVMAKLQSYVSNYRTEKTRNDLAYYEQLRDEAKDEYFAAQQKYARYVDANQGVVLQRVRIEQERLQNEVSLKFQLYNQTEQQVQVAKAKVQQETPVCAVIQPASVPRTPSPSTSKIVAIFIFLALVLDALWILWGEDFLARLKSTDEEAVSE